MDRRTAAIVALAVVVIGAAAWFVPHLTAKHPVVASTPSLQGQQSVKEVKLATGQRACIAPLPIDPNVREVQMVLHPRGSAPTPIAVELTGPGYQGHARFDGYAVSPSTLVTARLDAAPSTSADGTLCLQNLGRHSVGLVGTDEPNSLGLPATKVDGTPVGELDPAVTFLSGEQQSMLGRLSTIFDRAAGFTGVVPGALLWPFALLVLLGIPLGVALAIYRA
jgi:hypothetical protein